MTDLKLTIELVPKTSWFSNVRNEVPRKVWDVIRREVYKKAGYRCEICGGKGDDWPVECHEVWEYDDDNQIQMLEGFIALCPDCHLVKHYGLAMVKKLDEDAFKQFRRVNSLRIADAEELVDEAFDLWEERSQHPWEVDIYLLRKYGVDISERRMK